LASALRPPRLNPVGIPTRLSAWSRRIGVAAKDSQTMKDAS